MRKIFLGIFIVVMMSGIVSADLDGVAFINPQPNTYLSDGVLVQWQNNNTLGGLQLTYRFNGCESTNAWQPLGFFSLGNEVSYPWSTSSLSDGVYCLRLDNVNSTEISENFTIDNTAPTADFVYSGKQTIGETINFTATASDANGIVGYSWNFGDGSPLDISGATPNHPYSAPGTYNASLTVTDVAGNTKVVSHTIAISAIVYNANFSFDAVIKGVQDLNANFPTGLSSVVCTGLTPAPISEGLVIGQSGTNCTLTWTNIPYSSEKTHIFPVRVVDGTNASDILYFNVTVNAYAWSIPLSAGWNVFSIPLMPTDSSLNGVLGKIRTNIDRDAFSVFQYDAVSGWHKAKPTSTGWSTTGDLSSIVPGYSYWINMDNPDILKGFGYLNPTGGSPLSVQVANGWNLIGQYGYGFGMLLSQALSSLTLTTGSGLTTYYYDAVYDAETNTNVSSMDSFNGYWMSAKFLPNEVVPYMASSDAIGTVSP